MNRLIQFLLLTCFSINLYAQEAIIKGVIIDSEFNDPLIGVNVLLSNGKGAATNFDGEYSIKTVPGEHKVTYRYIGYKTITKNIEIKEGETKVINISLSESSKLDDVVVSASKYEQKLGEVPVSMAIIKPALIENKAIRDAEAIIEQVPGVQVNENQISIRGGSDELWGWKQSYGIGR